MYMDRVSAIKIYYYIIIIIIISYCSIQRDHLKKFNAKSDQNIHQDVPNCTFFLFFIFFCWGAWPLACVQLISLFLYENSQFLFRMLSKYTLKRINYKMFSQKKFRELYRNIIHLRNIGRIRMLLSFEASSQLIHALITTTLDYCNGILFNLPKNKIERLQRIQNQAARMLKRIPRRNNITPVLKDLHWLRINERI